MAIRRRYKNDSAVVQLTSPLASAATTAVVSDATSFPTSFPWTAVIDSGTNTAEIVLVTAATGSTLTLTRGYDGTAAQDHANGAKFAHAAVKADYDEANAHVTANSGVHGIVGNVVGDTDTQTLTNKTLTAAALTAPVVTGGAAITGAVGVTGAATVTSLHVTTTSTLTGAVSYGDDTGWLDLVLQVDWSLPAGKVAQCRLKDGVVRFRGQVSNPTFVGGTGAPVLIAGIPVVSGVPVVPYPVQDVEVSATGNSPYVRTLSVLTDGSVRMFAEAASSTGYPLSAISYLID